MSALGGNEFGLNQELAPRASEVARPVETIQMAGASSSEAARINPESAYMAWAGITLALIILSASFWISFVAISAAGEWTGATGPITWAFPIFIDGAILAYHLATMLFMARMEKTVAARWWLWLFTIVSVAANGAHAWENSPFSDWRQIAGTILAALAPIAANAATHTVIRLVVKPALNAGQPAGPASTTGPAAEPALAVVQDVATDDIAKVAVLALVGQKVSQRKIAERFDMSRRRVSQIINSAGPSEPESGPGIPAVPLPVSRDNDSEQPRPHQKVVTNQHSASSQFST